MTKEEIINETVEYFKDASKRGFNDVTRRCEFNSPNPEICAPGAMLDSWIFDDE